MFRSLWTRLAFVSVIFATSCAPTQTAAPSAPAPPGTTPVAAIENSITIGYPVALPSLDPHPLVAQTGAFAFQGIFDQLVRYDASGKLSPWLATDWRVIDAQNTQFNLRKDVKFQNGEEFDAAVAKWNIDRMRDPATRAVERATLITIDKVDAVDKYTLKISTTNPDPLLVRRLSLVRMIPPKYFEQVGAGDFGAGKAIGTGPYKIKEYFPNDRVVLEGVDSWRGKPKTQTVTLRFNPDRTPLAAGLRTGDIDAVFNLLPDQIFALKDQNFTVNAGVFPGAWYMEFNAIGSPPLRDRRVRQALNYAIDRDTIAKNLFRGLVQPAAQMVSPAGFGYDPNLKPYAYDLAKAKALMAEAGYANGFKMKATLTAGGRLFSEAVAGMWKELNVELELSVVDFGIFAERSNNGPIDDIWVSRSTDGDTRDSDASYQFLATVSPRPEPRVTWRNDRFVELYTQQRREVDETKRLALIRELIKLVYDEAPVMMVYYQDLTWVHSPKLRDFIPFPDTGIDIEKLTKVKG